MEMELLSNVMGSSFVKAKRLKRLRPWFVGEEEQGAWSWRDSTQEDEHHSHDEDTAAHSLMLLSHHSSSAANHVPRPTPFKRVMKKPKEFHSADSDYEGEKRSSYKCKTCSKAFLSFQALGGHRASCCHSILAECEQGSEKSRRSNKKKEHVCSICCRVFNSGQALGGHKRAHSSPPPSSHSSASEKENEERGELDLNMPPPLDETEDSSAAPFSTVLRSHFNDYKLSSPFWWMSSAGKRVPSVYNGGAADEAESKAVVGQDLRLTQDLFMVATAN